MIAMPESYTLNLSSFVLHARWSVVLTAAMFLAIEWFAYHIIGDSRSLDEIWLNQTYFSNLTSLVLSIV